MAVKRLLAIGGAEDREGDCEILKEFVRLAHGEDAEILIMTVATDEVRETVDEYRTVFRRLGVHHIKSVDVSLRQDTQSKRAHDVIENASGIFFSGGDQLNISSLLGGTEMLSLIARQHERGVVIAGTSAGAAMMSSSQLLSGQSEESPRFGGVEIGPGMDFLPGTIIDTHFAQRGRYGRLMTAVAHYPQYIGFGLDEDTAMLVHGEEFTVLGSGAVSVIDGGPISHSNLSELKHDERLELHNLTVHILPAGARFDLDKRSPIVRKNVAGRTAQYGSH